MGRPIGSKDKRIRKCVSPMERFWRKVRKTDGCWEWTGAKDGWGYGVIAMPRLSTAYKAHRLIWEQHNGAIPEGMFICHHCDNPGCVRIDHLFLGTPQDNSSDMMRKGRWVQPAQPPKECIRRGEQSNFSKLTEEKVFQIRHLALKGVSSYRMSKWFSMTLKGIRLIVLGKNWAHVPFPRHERDTLQEALLQK